MTRLAGQLKPTIGTEMSRPGGQARSAKLIEGGGRARTPPVLWAGSFIIAIIALAGTVDLLIAVLGRRLFAAGH